MTRYVTLNESDTVIGVRFGDLIIDGEIESESGEIGQIRLPDGTFIDDPTPQPEPQPTIDEQIYAENLYQTALLEMQMLGGV